MTTLEQLSKLEALMYRYQTQLDVTVMEHIKHTLNILIKVESYGGDLEAYLEDLMRKAEEKKKENSMYMEFVQVYDQFCKSHIGVGAKMDGAQGRALKSIIRFLNKESKSNDEKGGLLAWKFILQNWKMLSVFISKQTSLTSINKNLLEIITEFRNGRNAKQASKATTANIRNSIKGRG